MANFDWHAERSDLSGIALLDRAPESEGIDLKQVRMYRQARVREQMARYGVDAVILSDPINIRYATGTRNMQVFSQRNAPSRYLLLTPARSILFEFTGCLHLADGYETVDEVRPIARRALAEVFDLDYRQAPAEELERFRSALVARARRGSATLGDQRVPEPVLEPAERPRLVRARRPLDVAQPMDADPRPAPSFGGTDVRER